MANQRSSLILRDQTFEIAYCRARREEELGDLVVGALRRLKSLGIWFVDGIQGLGICEQEIDSVAQSYNG